LSFLLVFLQKLFFETCPHLVKISAGLIHRSNTRPVSAQTGIYSSCCVSSRISVLAKALA